MNSNLLVNRYLVNLIIKQKEADLPNIIQQFISESGDGDATIMIMVKNSSAKENIQINIDNMETTLTEENFKVTFNKGTKLISFERMIFDNNPMVLTEFETKVSRMDETINMRGLQYNIYNDNKIYIVICFVGSLDKGFNNEKRIEEYKPLMKKVINSVVINSQFEK